MTSFMQKLRVVMLGAAHDLLDKTIDLNSPSALRQYVRDLEDALSKMKSEAAIQAGAIRTLTREHDDFVTSIKAKKDSIQADINAGNQTRARQTATIVVTLQNQLERNEKDLASQKVASTSLDSAVELLELKHTDIVLRVRELERIDRTSKAKEQSAESLNAATKLSSMGSSISIDDIESKVRSRGDVADEQFSRAMLDTNITQDQSMTQAVDDLLSSMRPTSEKKTA
jgi:phage shock protein A